MIGAWSRFLRDRLSGKPALSWFFLLLSLGANALAWAAFSVLLGSHPTADDGGLYFAVYEAASSILIVLVFVLRGIWSMRALVAARTALLAVLTGMVALNRALGLLLAAPLVV